MSSGIAGLPEEAVKAGLPGKGGAAFFLIAVDIRICK